MTSYIGKVALVQRTRKKKEDLECLKLKTFVLLVLDSFPSIAIVCEFSEERAGPHSKSKGNKARYEHSTKANKMVSLVEESVEL